MARKKLISAELITTYAWVIWLVLMLLAVLYYFGFFVTTPNNYRECVPETDGWQVTYSTLCENMTIIMNGNLTITSGGSLILRNTTLIMNGSKDGQLAIEVRPRGR